MSTRLLKMAVIYLMLGIGLGMYMAISQNHLEIPVHAHINLVGWASMALCGLIYHQFPQLERHWLANVHFWLHSTGLPIGMAGLFLVLRGNLELIPVVAASQVLLAVGIGCFAINVLANIGTATRAS